MVLAVWFAIKLDSIIKKVYCNIYSKC